MGIKFSDMTDGELGAMVRSRHERLSEAYDAGLTDMSPRDRWNADSAVLRAHRDAKANDSTTTAEYREAETTGGIAGKVAGRDNPPDFRNKPANPTLGKPAVDGRYVVAGLDGQPRFEHADGRVTTGDRALVERAKQSSAEGTRRMNAHIRGLDRLK